ncbi:hypothetical protein N0M98_09425 [Paenibacillus doosanensis]|uniref:hypothetical protein n=1 Tax=Paenibacillus doosanensis TaxID=1229154 RepID=UPI00217F4CA3|nr:hypothetical protein [Paenibacillus doosanensis]MCS7460361.1 hypothetical protein [Paenibacillus doosanensis]
MSSLLKKRKKAKELFKKLNENTAQLLVVHYSCESFYDIPNGRTPRITSIAVRYYSTAQTKSFSIHKTAELKKVAFDEIEDHYDDLERDMLNDFYSFIRSHMSYYWLHWNMRDINYGFEAINHRYAVLGGTPVEIPDVQKVDLSKLLIEMFGEQYIDHPRLKSLLSLNHIGKKDMLEGKEEAEAFTNKEYVKLHQSTLRKVDVLHSLTERTMEGRLETKATFKQIYGYYPQGLFEAAKDNWKLSLIWTFVTLILSGIFGTIISKIVG